MAQRARELQQMRPNRIPPHNLDAEQSVLGAMLESQDAIANVVEVLTSDDFYKPAHTEIYEAIMGLFNRHEAIDAITIVDELNRRGTLEGIGGRPYILGLLEAYPTASAAARYARIVEELALLRRLISAGNEVQELGFSMPSDVADAVDTAEGLVYEVGNRRLRDELHQLKALLGENMEQIEQLYERGEHITGVSSGFTDLDDITAGFQKNNLIIIAARPAMGKSSLLNDFALAAALKRSDPVPVVIFTLEMSRHEVVKRFLASEAKVDSQRINRGTLHEQDWGRLSSALGRLAEAPIFIDDTANISLVEIRAKCRRLKAKHGLGLIIVDYLQLMQSPRKSENRQQEVSEISRNLKILARELEVPVLCASQLNRGVEMRADKRPLLGDLRESGCLTADTKVVRADTGQAVSIGELYELGEQNIPVWTLDDDFKLTRGTMTSVFSSGIKQTFRLKLRSGREIRASANHPFLSFDGWKSLADLEPGEHLAVPRRELGIHGERGKPIPEYVSYVSSISPNTNVGLVPRKMWDEIRRERLGRVTTVIRSPRLESLTKSDVFWDEVVDIVPDAIEEVFDATVPGTHNFIADGMVVHNSIEQDSDMVMFVYRDEVYHPDSEARGEAELIVAKHRNGPTGTVRLAFMNQYTKFASLAKVPR